MAVCPFKVVLLAQQEEEQQSEWMPRPIVQVMCPKIVSGIHDNAYIGHILITLFLLITLFEKGPFISVGPDWLQDKRSSFKTDF